MKSTKEIVQAVERYKGGNTESFNDIYEQSYRYLHTCIMHVVKNEDTAMDMLQETYLEICKSIKQLNDADNFMSWAATIANRKCFAYLKKQKDVLLADNEGEESGNYFENIADNEAFIPEAILQDREKQRLIKEIIWGLSDIQRLCVIGFYYNEQKQEEIAEELGIPVNTVKSHLNRAKGKIKEAVIDLDKKKGTKLYSIPVFMLLFLDVEARACETVAMGTAIKNAAESSEAAKVQEVTQNAANTNGGVKMAAGALKTKVIIGAVVGGLAVAGIAGAVTRDKGDTVSQTVTEMGADIVESNQGAEQSTETATETMEKSADKAENVDVNEALAISGEYVLYGLGNQGLIPAYNEEFKYGLVNYDNEIIVPFEYDYGCEMVNDEGQSFFRNDSGSYVFDREGKLLFQTEKTVVAVKDGVILTKDETADYVGDFTYYALDGSVLYQSVEECDYDWEATPFNEGYAFYSDWGYGRLSQDGTVDDVTYLVYGDQSAQGDDEPVNGIIANSTGTSFVMAIPLSPLNQGFLVERGLLISEDAYGVYSVRSVDALTTYDFDFSSMFNKEGLSFATSGANWGLRGFYDKGIRFSNYGTIISPYLDLDGETTCYLIDTAKVVENTEEYQPSGEFWSSEEYYDYDHTLLTEEAVLHKAEYIYINNETYWLVENDGQKYYIDHSGKVMNTYQDATEFHKGRAVIIEDGNAYVINESFEKLHELGPAAGLSKYGEVYGITQEDFSEKLIKISE